MLVPSEYLLFIQPRTPSHAVVTPTMIVVFPVSLNLIWKLLHRRAQRHVLMVSLNLPPVDKVTTTPTLSK